MVQVSLEELWLGAGVTRSGKTTFGKHLIVHLLRLFPETPTYVVDSKGDQKDFGSWPGIIETDDPPRTLRDRNGVQVWRPPTNYPPAYDEYFTKILETKKPAIVLVDELSSISHKDGTAVLGYQRLQKQGRGHGMCSITLTQEMSYIDRRAPGQMTHFVVFGLQNPIDWRKANVHLGRERDAPPPPDKYGFWYTRMDDRPHRPYYYSSYTQFF